MLLGLSETESGLQVPHRYVLDRPVSGVVISKISAADVATMNHVHKTRALHAALGALALRVKAIALKKLSSTNAILLSS